MKNFVNKYNLERYVIIIILTLLPLIACLAMSDLKISNVYLPNSRWNDEILYYKLIGAFADYKGPLGYFGYNESHAAVGNLGPWSPFLLPIFILYAKLFGWSLLSPIYCNLLLMTAAMFTFAFIVRPDRRQTFFIAIVYCLNYYYTRYTLSAMTEAYINALFLLFFSFSVGMFRKKVGGEKKRIHIVGYIIILNILAAAMTLARPYYVLLFCVPGYYSYKQSGKLRSIILQGLISVICVISYFACTKYLCAAYFSDIVKTEWLKQLFTNPLLGTYNFLKTLVSSSRLLLSYVGEGIVSGDAVASMWTVFIAVYFWICYKYRKEDKGNRILWKYCIVYLSLMILAVYYMYDIRVGSRHMATFAFLAIFMIAIFEKAYRAKLYIGIIFVWCLCVRANTAYYYQIPVFTEEKADIIRQGSEALAKFDLIDEDSDNPWDNTIIWSLDADFTHLYAIPDGMGINLCKTEYIQSNFQTLQPKYIMTNIDENPESIDTLCAASGKKLLAEYGTVHIWRLRN